ncbi:uncharacterized protein BYT42DRAFT_587856 [Radiomyces spectabilis]|uniref:uncharacterized protein n=1 Tax=Radiomyces spectabilis TaxID=64574 RepID=UPI002220919C|nr:uncharacterized protein BYT42DRAFT_587856 [Radiomyces spectabilis]KAI8366780.1 hypothetical protein BYT42DRAFT_587856 [Radiomyces spectabilis]
MKKLNSLTSGINSPIPTSLAGECKKAAKILNSFVDPGQGLDKVIPPNILANAQGLAIYTVLKAGFLFSGRAGGGLVVARLPDGSWSAPSAIGTGGIGAGGQIGAELTDFVLVLNTKQAVKTFSQFGNVTLGGNVSVAAGPIGRNAEASGSASLKHIAAIYSYSKTRGLFAGVSLEGSVVVTRGDANEKFYGRRVTAKELLNGTVAPPPEADALYRALNARFHNLGSTGAMYARSSSESSRSPTYKSSHISAPGTLSRPPAPRQQQQNPYYGAPSPAMGSYTGQPSPPAYNAAPSTNAGGYHNYGQPPQPPAPYAGDVKRAPPPPPPSRKPQMEPTARALYAFTGEQDGDLSFQEGDIITIVQKSDSTDDWWTGKLGHRQGMFPANYVQLLQ